MVPVVNRAFGGFVELAMSMCGCVPWIWYLILPNEKMNLPLVLICLRERIIHVIYFNCTFENLMWQKLEQTEGWPKFPAHRAGFGLS
jgi:hypothetical protein